MRWGSRRRAMSARSSCPKLGSGGESPEFLLFWAGWGSAKTERRVWTCTRVVSQRRFGGSPQIYLLRGGVRFGVGRKTGVELQ